VNDQGSGATGTVYLAYDKKGNKVAIKSMVKRLIPQISLQETEILASVPRHSNVVMLIEKIEEEEMVHLILNYIGQDNLMTFVNREGAFSESDARNLFHGMVSGLQHLHQHGVVHRDIKCENIMLTVDKRPILCDLGFATTWSKGKHLTEYCGSFHYAAPEIIMSQLL